ncbi:MAG: hypothetical protein RL713_1317, partial [Bacteroidota bacterium]
MKNSKVWALLLSATAILIMGCGGSKDTGNGIAGWYTMQSQVFTANGVENVIDHAEQRKVYTDEYYAFT